MEANGINEFKGTNALCSIVSEGASSRGLRTSLPAYVREQGAAASSGLFPALLDD
jgi:hypothetical protein